MVQKPSISSLDNAISSLIYLNNAISQHLYQIPLTLSPHDRDQYILLHDRIYSLSHYLDSTQILTKYKPFSTNKWNELLIPIFTSNEFFYLYLNVVERVPSIPLFRQDVSTARYYLDHLDTILRQFFEIYPIYPNISLTLNKDTVSITSSIQLHQYSYHLPYYLLLPYLIKVLNNNDLTINTHDSNLSLIPINSFYPNRHHDQLNRISNKIGISNSITLDTITTHLFNEFNILLTNKGYHFMNINTLIDNDTTNILVDIYPSDITLFMNKVIYYLKQLVDVDSTYQVIDDYHVNLSLSRYPTNNSLQTILSHVLRLSLSTIQIVNTTTTK